MYINGAAVTLCTYILGSLRRIALFKDFLNSRTQRTTQSARSSIAYEPATSFVDSNIGDDLISTRSSSCASINSDDEFTKLKTEREKERRDRVVRRLARSISGPKNLLGGQSTSLSDNEHLLLSELANTSRLSMAQGDHDEKPAESDRF